MDCGHPLLEGDKLTQSNLTLYFQFVNRLSLLNPTKINNKIFSRLTVVFLIIAIQLIITAQAQVRSLETQQNHHKTKPIILSDQNFTFNKNGSYLQIDATKEWPFNAKKEISFRFKTKSPHGLLIYQTFDHSKLAREDDLEPPDPVHVFSTSSVPARTRLKLIENGISSKVQNRVSKTIEASYRKRFKQLPNGGEQYEEEPELSKLASSSITATASEKLVNSIFSSSPAAAINGNFNRMSPVELPVRERSTANSAKDSTRNFHLMEGLDHPEVNQKGAARANYGSHSISESKDGTTVLSSSAISSYSGSIYELYLKLENGRLKTMFEYGSRLNQTYCGKGLNDDRWHKVNLKVDPETNQMLLVLDQVITVDISLGPLVEEEAAKWNELFFTNSVLYIGGLNNDASTVKNMKQRLYMAQFIGCIGQILLKTDQATESTQQPVPIESMVSVELGCINKCDRDNYCLHGSPCINLYSSTKCDCFGTKYEDTYCWQDQLTTLSMFGHSILVYRIYDWKDRHHSSINRFSMQFKTLSQDSILFFASGDLTPQLITKSFITTQQPSSSSSSAIQIPLVLAPSNLANFSSTYRPIGGYQSVGSTNYMAVSLSNGSLVVEINFGDQPILLSSLLYDSRIQQANKTTSKQANLADGKWHNITLIHNYKHLSLHLDNQSIHHAIMGKNYHLYLDPNIYLGSVPNLLYNDTRVLSRPFDLRHKFIGCLKSVYFNQFNILLDLKKQSSMAEYRDISKDPQFGSCSLQHPSNVPVTLRSGRSYLTFALAPDPQPKLVDKSIDQKNISASETGGDTLRSQSNYSLVAPRRLKIEFDYKTPLKSHFLSGGYLIDLSFPDLGGFWALYASESCRLYLIINSGLTSQHDQIIQVNSTETDCDPEYWHSVSMSVIFGDKSINITRVKQEQSIGFEEESRAANKSISLTNNATQKEMKSYRLKSAVEMIHQVQFGGDIGKFGESTTVPFTGCIRRIKINDQLFDSRELVSDFLPKSFFANGSNTVSSSSTSDIFRVGLAGQIAQGYITLDSCRLFNHCASMNPCQNNGTCRINNLGEPECDCTRTGYVGRRCQFSIYKQSCQDIYLTGQRKSSFYLIDLDRNGPLKPIRVRCNMDGGSGQIETVLTHNLPQEYLVKTSTMKDLKIDITYSASENYYSGLSDSQYYNEDNLRNEQDLMLRTLIGQSTSCKQYFRYECRSAPLDLGSRTWFETPFPRTHKLNSLDGLDRGRCVCASSEKKCLDPTKSCNCDSNEPFWADDSYELTNQNDVAITKIVILRQQNIDPNLLANSDSQSRFTLGDLKCFGNKRYENQHEITFKTSGAYIEVPGWRRGDISFSFRTASNPPAIILFQLATSRNHGYLRLTLIADSRLLFEFIVNRKPRRLYLTASHKLNNGEWQQVYIEYNSFNLRLSVNDDSALVELDMNDYLGTFEGPLFIGGAPSKYLTGDLAKRNGFTGCFRGLYIDGQSIDLKSYLNPAMPTVISACKPSCTKNLCQNGGKCIEYWGSYECECANPIAHSGINCEINLNTNSITFQTEKSYYVQVQNETVKYPTYLVKNILLNIRTYQETALVLYISDHLNNFIQLHKNRSSLVLTYNSNDTIIMAQLPIDKTPELKGLPETNESLPATATNSPDNNTNNKTNQQDRGKNNTTLPIETKDHSNTTLNFSLIDKSIRVSNTSGSGEPIQIKIGRQRTHTTFFVNNNYLIIEQPIILLSNYTQNPWTNPELESVRPPRPKMGSKTYFQIFLANIDDYFTTRLPGFTGCIQGLSIDNQPFDFNRAHLTGEFNGDYRIGCKMHCDLFPCKNQGVCIENWKEDKIQCKCDATSYVGKLCDEDIAAVFNGHTSYFIYHPTKKFNSTPTPKTSEPTSPSNDNKSNSSTTKEITKLEKIPTRLNPVADAMLSEKQIDMKDMLNIFEISLAFSTDSSQLQSSAVTNHLNRVQVLILMTIANSTRHFFLGITADGSLLIQEDYGSSMSLSRLIKPAEHTFNDGNRHMIKYTRYNQSIHINVDYQSYLPTLSVITTSHIHRLYPKSSVILVGTAWMKPSVTETVHLNDSSSETNYMNYSGCISNLVIKMDNILIEPFSEAFGQNMETTMNPTNESKIDNSRAMSELIPNSKPPKSGGLIMLVDQLPGKDPFATDTLGIDKGENAELLSDKLILEGIGESMEVIQTKDVEQGKCASFRKSETSGEKRSANEPRLTYLQELRPVYIEPPKVRVYERATSTHGHKHEFLLKIGPVFYCSLGLLCFVSLSAVIYSYILHIRYKSEKFRCETPFFHKRDKAPLQSSE